MHISTDEITMNKVYDGGVPYIIKHNEGPMSTIGISLGNELSDKRKPCQADRSGKRAPVSQCKTQSDRCYLHAFFFLKGPGPAREVPKAKGYQCAQETLRRASAGVAADGP